VENWGREREREEASKYVSHVQALRNCAKSKRFFLGLI